MYFVTSDNLENVKWENNTQFGGGDCLEEEEYTVIVEHANGVPELPVDRGDTIRDLKRKAATILDIPLDDLDDFRVHFRGRRLDDGMLVRGNIQSGENVKLLSDVEVGF